MSKKTVVCEYVGFGHPDMVADQISDALLDELLKQDPNARAGIEVMVKDNTVVLGGEVKFEGTVDYDATVKDVFQNIPYPSGHHLSPREIKVINLIGRQSPEISRGVDKADGTISAGDQGFCVGMATNETNDYMPLGMHVAKKICQYIARLTDRGFGPDCKSQVIVEYDEKGNARIDSVLVSTMHQGDLEQDRRTIEALIRANQMKVWDYVFVKYFLCTGRKPKIIVNPCGEWRIGGSVSDCGITNRKIVVNQFGGYAPVGGGGLSGKDMSKVDRSGAYMCRYLAKNIVAAGLADTAKVELSYMIGVPNPSSINIELNRGQENIEVITEWIKANIDLSVSGMFERFDGIYPRFFHFSRLGHYGATDKEMQEARMQRLYPWEKTDFAGALAHFLNTKK